MGDDDFFLDPLDGRGLDPLFSDRFFGFGFDPLLKSEVFFGRPGLLFRLNALFDLFPLGFCLLNRLFLRKRDQEACNVLKTKRNRAPVLFRDLALERLAMPRRRDFEVDPLRRDAETPSRITKRDVESSDLKRIQLKGVSPSHGENRWAGPVISSMRSTSPASCISAASFLKGDQLLRRVLAAQGLLRCDRKPLEAVKHLPGTPFQSRFMLAP